jgi:hypothetical protein
VGRNFVKFWQFVVMLLLEVDFLCEIKEGSHPEEKQLAENIHVFQRVSHTLLSSVFGFLSCFPAHFIFYLDIYSVLKIKMGYRKFCEKFKF